jgi:hypothetical protein
VAEAPIALKRLAAVEVEANTSHQHEFNATLLRRGLGIDATKVSGPLSIVFYTRDDEDPVVEDTSYTLYDSRKGKLWRSPEYRLYYRSPVIGRLARPGDLLVIYRDPDDALQAIVARPGTQAEADLTAALLGGATPSNLKRFLVVTPAKPSVEGGSELAAALSFAPSPLVAGDLEALVAASVELEASIANGTIPTTKEMAAAAQVIVQKLGGDKMAPDAWLSAALAAETALYSEIEGQVGAKLLKTLIADGKLTFPEVIKFAMKYHQSRKSRRGQSLQNHLATLLHREGIPYSAQKTTEGKEKPDFVIPSISDYHDPEFPRERLRMVACKSRTRERWDQVLNEAARIDEKFLLTVDEDLTDDVIQHMADSGIKIFLPQSIIDDHYAKSPKKAMLGNMSELLERLREVVD